MKIYKNTYIVSLLCLLISCNTEKKSTPIEEAETIVIENLIISDTTYSSIKNLLKLDEYIILEKDVPLANINRVIVTEKQIFIFDSEPKIVCYNREGKVEFKISNKGRGVGEFIKVVDFSLDKRSQTLKIYDSSLRKVLYYDSKNGSFKYDRKISIAPHAIANFGNYDYYYNPYSFNYPNSKEYHYSLIKSEGENDFVGKYFSHDPIISNYMFGNNGEFPFFYGDNELLFVKRFEKTIYAISDESISSLFEIELPNAVPQSYIQNKPKPIELIESQYSSGLTDVYRANNVLYFAFTNSGNFISTFYDLSLNKVIYCGKRIWPKPSKELPVYYPIRGVFEDKFFSLINPSAIVELSKNNESIFPDGMLEINEIDNPVIAFYSVNNEK